MAVVSVLPEKCNGCLSIIWIKLRHIEVIDEVDQLSLTLWTELPTCFLFQRLLQLRLQVHRIGVVIEVDEDKGVIVRLGFNYISEDTLCNLCLTATRVSNK